MLKEVRCGKCSRLLAKSSAGEIQIKCPRCGTINHTTNHQKATSLPSSAPRAP